MESSEGSSRVKAYVFDPPKHAGKYVFQEECCWDLRAMPTVPARALQVAAAVGAEYVEPFESWTEVGDRMGELLTEPGVTFYLLMTRPLWAAFEGAQAILADLQARWTILANPSDSVEWFAERFPAAKVLPIDAPFNGDALPHPLWVDFARLCKRYPMATLQAASGCPYGCRYCVWGGRKTRWADPVRTGWLSCTDVGEMYLLAPQLTGDDDWAASFILTRQQRAGERTFKTTLNCAYVETHERAIVGFAGVGMDRALVGTEAFCDAALKRLGCPHTVAQAAAMVRLLARLGVSARYELRTGYGETVAEIDEAAANLAALGPTAATGPHVLRVGRIIYWPSSRLPLPAETETIEPYGVPVVREKLDVARQAAWQRCFATARAAGWKVRG